MIMEEEKWRWDKKNSYRLYLSSLSHYRLTRKWCYNVDTRRGWTVFHLNLNRYTSMLSLDRWIRWRSVWESRTMWKCMYNILEEKSVLPSNLVLSLIKISSSLPGTIVKLKTSTSSALSKTRSQNNTENIEEDEPPSAILTWSGIHLVQGKSWKRRK